MTANTPSRSVHYQGGGKCNFLSRGIRHHQGRGKPNQLSRGVCHQGGGKPSPYPIRLGVCHLDEVNCDFAYRYAVAMGEAIGIVDACLVDHYAVAALQVAYVEAVRAGNDLGMQAGGGYL